MKDVPIVTKNKRQAFRASSPHQSKHLVMFRRKHPEGRTIDTKKSINQNQLDCHFFVKESR